jgi:hypothetical protein
MTVVNIDNLDPAAIGLCLHRHDARDNLIACELVIFRKGASAVNTVLRRASLSGFVKVEPFDEPMDYFADVYVSETEFTQSVLLDRGSYRSLKNKWMRCKLDRAV